MSFEYLGFGIILLILLATLLTALLAAPNTWDSMTYHLSRVAHWLQNRTVANYPTAIARQLSHPPFAEYVITHSQILSHSDRFANLVQWLSLLGCLNAVSLIAKELGASRRAQICASVLGATLPVAILQSSGTQNDLVVSFWILCLVHFTLRFKPDSASHDLWGAAASLALAVLTKATAYFLIFPFVLLMLWPFRRSSLKKILAVLFPLLALPLLLNGAFYLRQAQLGRDTISALTQEVVTQDQSPQAIASILFRNIASELGTPWPHANRSIERAVEQIHNFFTMNSTDAKTTLGQQPFHFPDHPFHEDHASNSLGLLILGVGIILFLARPSLRQQKLSSQYLLALCATALLFTAFFKWQPWVNRFHLPLFLLTVPLAAMAWEKTARRLLPFLIVMAFALSLPWVLGNQSRPLIGKKSLLHPPRFESYFANQPGYIFSYRETARQLKKNSCQDVGVILGDNSWEYPLWAALSQGQKPLPRLEHINVQNTSKNFSYPLGLFNPCAIVADPPVEESLTQINFNGQTFIRTRLFAFLSVYERDDTGALARQAAIVHFSETLSLTQTLMTALAQVQDLSTLVPEESTMLSALGKRIHEKARMVSIADLNAIYPELGTSLEQGLISGVEIIVAGLQQKNPDLCRRGQARVHQWLLWINERQTGIDQGMKFSQSMSR